MTDLDAEQTWRCRYLELTGPEQLKAIFRADLDADLMAEITHVLVTSWELGGSPYKDTAHFAVRTLNALVSTSRFSLLRDFLDNNQLEKVQELLSLVDQQAFELDAGDIELVDDIRAKFRLSK